MGLCYSSPEEEPLLQPRTPAYRKPLVSSQPLAGPIRKSPPFVDRVPVTTATPAPIRCVPPPAPAQCVSTPAPKQLPTPAPALCVSTPAPKQCLAAAVGVARFSIEIPGLIRQPSILTQTLTYNEVSDHHISWLLASAPSNPEGLRFVGLDTEFDGPLLGLIQLATDTRCLLVVVAKPGKKRSLSKALDTLFHDPAVRKTGCELTNDALLLNSNFGHVLRGGIDLTHAYSPATLKSTNRNPKGLFTLFSELYLPSCQPLRKDKATTTSRWVGVPLTEAQLSYGVLDAWISYKVGIYDPSKIARAMVLDLTKIDPGLLKSLADQNDAVLAIEHMQKKQYDSKFSAVTLRADGKYDIVNSQFRNKLHFKDDVLFYLASGEALSGKVEAGQHGKTKTVKLDNPLKAGSAVKSITVVKQSGPRAADSFLSQTNAATRNLALALLKRGVTDFRIVVSDGFYVEWHEDQYRKIRDRVIHSSETRSEKFDKLIGPRTVVLCSLCQLSNSNMINILHRRRVTHIVIDEASQICLADLVHIPALFQGSLKRLTFVGDPKQLAPFGNEQHPAVQSVFERLHSDVMLNVQYRMPCDLGAFISSNVYNHKLLSHQQPRKECTVALIDVADGTEQASGTGFTNLREADAVVHIIVNQFLTREFLVITPYNAQKELIANRLRDAIRKRYSQGESNVTVTFADERVHTVDTVQGQEADVIVFSAVRTSELGFLKNKRRMNVALTRAKDRLVVVAHMALFRNRRGKKCLLAALLRDMEKITPLVNSKQLSTGFKLDFKRIV
ncbi:hypothetical protein HDU86_000938 [Geranomyces michiganensis]|nr:hypothetical protein HDU86_000938 [Geranomyces michiganensis]